MPKLVHHIAVFALLSAYFAAPATAAVEQRHRGIRLLTFDAETPTREIAVTPPDVALSRLARAYDTLIDQSPASAQVVQMLRGRGTVMVVYYPGSLGSRQSLNAETVALYLPDFLKKRGKSLGEGPEFIVVVNHIGIRWDRRELAGLIAHELVGHGGQHLRGILENSRPIDLECEASLHEEQAYQDLKLNKSSRTMVIFRKRMETHHCADFRAYLKRARPRSVRLWGPKNPDVRALLREFERYRRAQIEERKRNQLSRHNR